MRTVNKDRESLKRIVESYGKEDVLKYVKHINEGVGRFDEMTMIDKDGTEDVEEIYYVCSADGDTASTKNPEEFEIWMQKRKFPSYGITGGYGPSSVGRKTWKPIAQARVRRTIVRTEVDDIPVPGRTIR